MKQLVPNCCGNAAMRTTLCCVLTEEMHLSDACVCQKETPVLSYTRKDSRGGFLGGCMKPRIHMSKYGTQQDTNTHCHASCPPIHYNTSEYQRAPWITLVNYGMTLLMCIYIIYNNIALHGLYIQFHYWKVYIKWHQVF